MQVQLASVMILLILLILTRTHWYTLKYTLSIFINKILIRHSNSIIISNYLYNLSKSEAESPKIRCKIAMVNLRKIYIVNKNMNLYMVVSHRNELHEQVHASNLSYMICSARGDNVNQNVDCLRGWNAWKKWIRFLDPIYG